MTRSIKKFIFDFLWFTLGWLAVSGIAMAVLTWAVPTYPITRFAIFASIFLFSELLGLILIRLTTGPEFVTLRLGGAAFCRTIVPLLLSLAFAWYSKEPLGRADIVPLLAVYGYGIVLGTVLSVRHLQSESPGGGKPVPTESQSSNQ